MSFAPPRASGIDDDARLAALASFGILDTPPERGFDDVVHLACRVCSAPVALVSFVDRDRQWFKARSGFPACETDLGSSVCAHALVEPGLLVVPDLTRDPRTRDNPLVTGAPHIRFYAGAPLRTPEGQTLGTLCVIDHVPRPGGLSPAQAEDLEALARQVMGQLLLRRALADRDDAMAGQRRFLVQRATLIETQDAVAASEGDRDTILSTLVAGALQAVPEAEGAAIEMREGDELVYRSVAGTLAPHLGLRLPLSGSLSGAALRGGPILSPDVLRDERVKRDLVAALGMRAAIYVPVSRGGAAVGVLKLQSARPDAFTDRDLEMAQVFAGAVSAGLAEAGEAEARRNTRESERQLGLERGLLRAVLQQAPVGISIAHTGGGALLNDRMEDMLGHGIGGADDACDAGYGAVHADGRPFAAGDHPTLRALRRGEIVDGEAMGYRNAATGTVRRWRAHSTPVRDVGGAIIAAVSVFIDVEDEERAAQALRDSEARYRQLIDLSPAIIWYGHQDGTLSYVSDQIHAFTGRTRADLPPERWPEVIHPDDLPGVQAAWAEARAAGGLYDTEFRIRHHTGAYRWFAVRAAPVRGPDGAIVGWLGHNTEIEARRAAETEARRLAALVEQSGDFIGITGPGGAVDFVNAAGRRLLGLPDLGLQNLETARNARLIDCVVPEERARIRDAVLPTVAREGFWEGELHVRNADTGAAVPVLFSLFPVRDRAGGLLGYGTVGRDLTERKAAEAEARKLATIVEQSNDFIAVSEADGTVAWINRAGLRMVGLSGAPAAGIDLGAAYAPESRAFLEAVVTPALRRDGHWRGELRMRHAVTGAEFPVLHDSVALRDEAGAVTGYATVTRDITDQKRAQEHQDLLNRELSHRMKNLLAMVQALASQTLRGAGDIEAAREVLCDRLIALGKAHDILLGGAAERAPLASVVREGVGVQEGAGNRVAYAGPEVEIGGKAALSLALTLHELTTNAVKYGALAAPEGSVRVTASLVEAAGVPSLRILWTESGGPPVTPPARRGFGSRLIERSLTGQVGGSVRLDYPRTGVTCAIEAPLAGFQATD